MGVQCSTSDPKEPDRNMRSGHTASTTQTRTHSPVLSRTRSPVVSAFTVSNQAKRRRRRSVSGGSSEVLLNWGMSDDEDASDVRSVPEKLPVNRIRRWLDDIPPPDQLDPIPEPDIWSDGEREGKEWLRTEGGLDDLNEGRWDAPHYVSALELASPTEHEPLYTHSNRRKQKAGGFRNCA